MTDQQNNHKEVQRGRHLLSQLRQEMSQIPKTEIYGDVHKYVSDFGKKLDFTFEQTQTPDPMLCDPRNHTLLNASIAPEPIITSSGEAVVGDFGLIGLSTSFPGVIPEGYIAYDICYQGIIAYIATLSTGEVAEWLNIYMPPTSIGCVRVTEVPAVMDNEGLRVRNLPTQSGRTVGRVAPGTIWQFYASRLDNDGTTWYQIAPVGIGSFGAENGSPAWIPSNAPPDYGDDDLYVEMLPNSDCINAVDLEQPGDNILYQSDTRHPIRCSVDRVEVIPSGWSDEQFLTFVLAIESSWDVVNATQHAFTIRARLLSDYFFDDVMDVILQTDCHGVKAFSAVDVIQGDAANLGALYNGTHPDEELVKRVLDIQRVAHVLLTGGDFTASLLPFTSINPESEYAAYTLGVNILNFCAISDLEGDTAEEKMLSFEAKSQEEQRNFLIDIVLGSCMTCICEGDNPGERLRDIYSGHSRPARATETTQDIRGNVSIFFTDNHNCTHC